MENILLKRATLDDLREVLDIESVACSKIYFCRRTEQEVKDYINNDIVYLIKRGDIIVGTISYEMKTQDHAYINGLIIKSQYRDQGISKQAVEILLDELKDKKRIDLPVHPYNNPAIMLYLSLGFIIESWRDNHYGDGEPRLILVYKK
jgi:ribosomal protein S18 acetylase RimI-like enzyme